MAARQAYFLLGKNKVTFVPQTGHLPWAILRPLSVVITVPFLIDRLVLHLTQYASKSIPYLLRWNRPVNENAQSI